MSQSGRIQLYILQRRMETGANLWMFGLKARNRDTGSFVYSTSRTRKDPITIPWKADDFSRIFHKEVLLDTTPSKIGNLARLIKSVDGNDNQKWMLKVIMVLARHGLVNDSTWLRWKDKFTEGHRYIAVVVPLGRSSTAFSATTSSVTTSSTTSESSSSGSPSPRSSTARQSPARPPLHPGTQRPMKPGPMLVNRPRPVMLSASVISPEQFAAANISPEQFYEFRGKLVAQGIPLDDLAISLEAMGEPAARSSPASSSASPLTSLPPAVGQSANSTEANPSSLRSCLGAIGVPLDSVRPTEEGVKAIPEFPSADEIAARFPAPARPPAHPPVQPVAGAAKGVQPSTPHSSAAVALASGRPPSTSPARSSRADSPSAPASTALSSSARPSRPLASGSFVTSASMERPSIGRLPAARQPSTSTFGTIRPVPDFSASEMTARLSKIDKIAALASGRGSALLPDFLSATDTTKALSELNALAADSWPQHTADQLPLLAPSPRLSSTALSSEARPPLGHQTATPSSTARSLTTRQPTRDPPAAGHSIARSQRRPSSTPSSRRSHPSSLTSSGSSSSSSSGDSHSSAASHHSREHTSPIKASTSTTGARRDLRRKRAK